MPYSEKGSSLKFLRLAGLKETSERTCVIFFSKRDCERRRAHMLLLNDVSIDVYIDGDGDINSEFYMHRSHVKVL